MWIFYQVDFNTANEANCETHNYFLLTINLLWIFVKRKSSIMTKAGPMKTSWATRTVYVIKDGLCSQLPQWEQVNGNGFEQRVEPLFMFLFISMLISLYLPKNPKILNLLVKQRHVKRLRTRPENFCLIFVDSFSVYRQIDQSTEQLNISAPPWTQSHASS